MEPKNPNEQPKKMTPEESRAALEEYTKLIEGVKKLKPVIDEAKSVLEEQGEKPDVPEIETKAPADKKPEIKNDKSGTPKESAPAKKPELTEKESLAAQARKVAKKIHDLGGAQQLDPQDQQFRNQNWGMVEVALIEMHQQDAAKGSTLTPDTAPASIPLEQGRNMYLAKILELDSKIVLTESERQELYNVRRQYMDAYLQELAKIPVSKKKERLEFAKKEGETLWDPVYLTESRIDKERFERTMTKYGQKVSAGSGFLQKAILGTLAVPAAPILVAQHFGGQLAEAHGNTYSKLMDRFMGNDKDKKDAKSLAKKSEAKPAAKTEDKKKEDDKTKNSQEKEKEKKDLSKFITATDAKKTGDKKESGKNDADKSEERKTLEADGTESVDENKEPEETRTPQEIEAEKNKKEAREQEINDIFTEAFGGYLPSNYQEERKLFEELPLAILLNPTEVDYDEYGFEAPGDEWFENYPNNNLVSPEQKFFYKKLSASFNKFKEEGIPLDSKITVGQFLNKALDEKLLDLDEEEPEREDSEEVPEEAETAESVAAEDSEIPVPPTI